MIDTRYRTALPPSFQNIENKANINCGYNYGGGYGYGYNYGSGNGYTYTFDYGNGYTATVTEKLTPVFSGLNAQSVSVNMNARLYDPAIGRFLSPDPYVPNSSNSQDFNRYTYTRNNPLRYTDPDGEFLLTMLFLHFTDAGYQLQKYISPVAFRVDFRFGTHQTGIGYDAGIGVPKTIPVAPWKEYGQTYFWKNYGDYRGWETRIGTETTYLGLYTSGETKYKAGEFSQTVGYKKIGIPGNMGIDIYNDLWGDGGDRFRTSRVRLNMGLINAENVLFTGDPGLDAKDRDAIKIEECGPKLTYIKKRGDPYAPDPDKYRHGVLSLGMGPVSFGLDSEKIRYGIQNVIVHNLSGSRFFRYEKGVKDRRYIQFGAW